MSGDDSLARAIDAMTEVQRRSVEAAAALVERLVASVDGHEDADASDVRAPSDDDALVAFAKLWRQSMTSFAAAVTRDRDEVPHIDVSAGGAASPVRVTLDPYGDAAAEVWLHNPTGDALDKLRVHATALRAHDGAELSAAVSADPDAFGLPARSSRGVTLAVSAPDARTGVYRGLVLVEGLPEQWLPIEVTVA